MSAYCNRERWANATKKECCDELVKCLVSCSKPTKFALMRILELLGGHYEERTDQRRGCSSCKFYQPKEVSK